MLPKHIGASLMVLFSVNAVADSPFRASYIGANVQDLTLSSGSARDISLHAAYGRFGDRISDYLSLELRLGTGTESARISNGTDLEIEVSVDKYYGIYFLGGIPITEYFYPYIVAGFSKLEVDVVEREENVNRNPSSLSIGAGFNFPLGNDFVVNAEYLQVVKENGLTVAGPSLGIALRF